MSLLGIKKIDASTTAIQVQFIPQPPLDPVKIIRIVQSNPAIHLNGQDRIKYLPPKDASFEKLEQRIEAIRQLMKLLSGALIAGAHALPTPALSA
jgi:transcription-repair coupling factor (superfamily II helicase)